MSKISAAPLRQVVRITGIDGKALETTVRGSIHKVKGEANLYFVRDGKVSSREYRGDTKVDFTVSAEDRCTTHTDEPLWQIPSGMVYCKACEREVNKRYREAKRNGTPLDSEAKAQAKVERTERVIEQQRIRTLSRETMLGNLFRGQAKAGQYAKGSQARRDAYSRALMTASANLHKVTVEKAAELAGIDTFAPLSWSEFRSQFPTRDAQVEDAA